jgi:hypothetical protein
LGELNHKNSKNANASAEERAESGMWSLEVSILQHCQSPASPSVVLAVLQMHMATGNSIMFRVEKRTTCASNLSFQYKIPTKCHFFCKQDILGVS